jgi:uncharacterized glyoxalase superfamily protein PhnB
VKTLDKKYECSRGYIITRLPLLEGLHNNVTIAGRNYLVKPNFHCSLVAIKKIAPLVARLEGISQENAEERVTTITTEIVNRVQPKFSGYLNDVRLAEQPERDRYTIIVMAQVDGLPQVFAEINHQLNLDQPVQPAHVTLYTAANELPIGATTPAELDAYTHALSRGQRSELTTQMDPYKVFTWSQYMSPTLIQNNLILELHIPSFAPAREFYSKFGFTEIDYDPISGGGTSDLGYFEMKREDPLGRTQLNFYGDKKSVAGHAHFSEFPPDTPRGYGVEITIPVTDVERLWQDVGSHLSPSSISEPLTIKRWGKRDFRVVDPYGFYVRFTQPVDWNQDK